MSIRKNSIKVKQVMLGLDNFPVLKHNTILKEVLEKMSGMRIGIACIVDENLKLLGVITDGDIRRMLLRVQKPFSAFFTDDAIEHAITSPLCTYSDETLLKAIELMDEKRVWDLPVVDDQGRLLGLLHLHPAIKAVLTSEEC